MDSHVQDAREVGVCGVIGSADRRCGLVGLFISMHSIFNNEAKNATNLLQSNLSLAAEIAQRERVEEKLRRAHDELEARVRSRTADLAGANQALQSEVTDRVRAEETLSAERTMLRALIDNVPDFMYAKDTESGFIVSACSAPAPTTTAFTCAM